MQVLRAFSLSLLAFSSLASAQSRGAGFSLPPEARAKISAALTQRAPNSAWPQVAELTASDGAADSEFGASIAISDDTVVVGSSDDYLNEVYVFVKPSTGWADMTETAILTAKDGPHGLGYTVAIYGDTIVAGSLSPGNAYVYVRPEDGWHDMTESAELQTPSDGVYELALSDRTMVVSSADNPGTSYVYVKPEGGWRSTSTPSATLAVPYYGIFCQFCVGVSGNTIAVGTPGSFSSEGTVYVFAEPQGGWQGDLTPTAVLVASNGDFGDQLGIAVAVGDDGRTIVAGANARNEFRGALYVFVEPTAGWADMSQTAELTAPDSLDLGWSVAISGSTIVGGAFLTTVGSNQMQGAAYIYQQSKNGWKTTDKFSAEITSSNGAPLDDFGASVGVSGTTAVAGAPGVAIGDNINEGAAYVFQK
jgi:hypothetical protein